MTLVTILWKVRNSLCTKSSLFHCSCSLKLLKTFICSHSVWDSLHVSLSLGGSGSAKHIEKNGQTCLIGQWRPTISYLRKLSSKQQHKYAARRSSTGESGTVQVTAAVFRNILTLFCTVSSVICDPAYFSGLSFKIFCLFTHTVIVATVSVREEWNFLYCFMPLQTFASHVISRGILLHSCVQAPHWRRVTGWWPNDISTHLVGLCSYIKLYTALSLMLTKDHKTHLPTKIHVICPTYVLKKVLKWHALTPTSDLTSTHIKVSQGKKPNKTLMELSPPPTLSNSGPSRVTRSLRGEVYTSSPFSQKKKQEAKRMKSNFKELVHEPNSSNSD